MLRFVKPNGRAIFHNGSIEYVGTQKPNDAVVIDGKNQYLIPGFIDLHCHGGNGLEFMDASVDEMEEIAKFHLSYGTTTLLPTTLAERKTRFYIAIKIPDRKGSTLAKAVIATLSQLPKGAVKTITCDRGSEFANWREIESALNCQMYFADPYCAWQKGTNENLNGLLREFYPKGHNLSRVSQKTFEKKSGVD